METFPENPFETMKARIVGGDETHGRVSRGAGGNRVVETME